MKDLERRRLELESKWLHKDVRVERPPTPAEIELHRIYGQPDNMSEGGEGVCDGFYIDEDEIWMSADWGMAWLITEDTTITEIENHKGPKSTMTAIVVIDPHEGAHAFGPYDTVEEATKDAQRLEAIGVRIPYKIRLASFADPSAIEQMIDKLQ